MRSAAVAVLLTARLAAANPADDAFEHGRTLLGEKKYAEACAAFEQSLALDFQFGTLYNIATCDEQIGKLASALRAYRKLARDDVNPSRKQSSADAAAKLAPRVPRLVVAVVGRPAGLHVQLDGNLVDDELSVEIPVDLGEHVIAGSAPGKADQQRRVVVHEPGELQKVELTYTERAPVQDAQGSSRATAGKVMVIGGGAVLVAGLVVGGLALSAWHTARDEAATDVDQANADVHHVQTLGNISTVCVVVGAVAVAAGLYLWRSGSGSVAVSPQIGSDSAGAMLLGRF